MLDNTMIEQLREVFSKLDSEIVLKMAGSSHSSQIDLEQMLDGISKASGKVKVEALGKNFEEPYFEIHTEGAFTGISFKGVPGGHEFSSLVLAILNANQKGKLPDEGFQARIKNLKGPVSLRTFVSLSCENCPEVVQALNLMACLHKDFIHQTIDGAVVSQEIDRLNIQGVPAVFSGDKLISSGKISLGELVQKLEEEFGKSENAGTKTSDLGDFDVVIVGGGPAGASSAIYSARKGLKVAVVAERMGGQLMDTLGIENMISNRYTEGKKLAAQLSDHLEAYPIQLFEHRKVKTIEGEKQKTLQLESGESLRAKTVIVATGAQWRKLGVPGEREHIGQGVAFCAHCDGPFYKGKKVVVVGGGNSGVEAALDLSEIVESLVLLEFAPELRADKVLVEKLKKTANAKIITDARTTEVIGKDGKVVGLKYENRKNGNIESLDTDGVFVQIGLIPNTQFLKGTVELTPMGEIVVDGKSRTSVSGIYAAGDVTTIPFKQIITAMGDGAKVGLAAFEDQLKK